jgi:hypothetical protein
MVIKMKLKIIPLLLAFVLCTALPGCGDKMPNGGEKIDPNRKQLYVGNFNGGMGSEWMDELDKAFEAAYPEYQVIVDNKKLEYNGAQLSATMKTNRQDIYFTTEVNYFDFIAEGHFEDITSVVTEKFETVDGIEYSIEDKIEPTVRKYFNKDNKYYAIPFFTAVYGIVYDKDLFEENYLYGLPDYSSQFGPDGMEGTYDDGLPATWNDFVFLMEEMIRRGITPFTWANMSYYRTAMLKALWANYEGYDDYLLNYSFNGTHSSLGEIREDNGYILQNQGGKKAAIQAAYDIMHTQIAGKKAYSSRATDASQSNIAAQEEFISSRPTADPQRDKYPIAMMFEGGWWENEARGAFDDLVLEYGEEYGYGNRRFGYMPFPRFVGTPNVPDQINTKPMLYSDIESSVFISAYSPRKDIAKKFLQFSTSNAMLSLCTKITGVVRPFTYTMSKEDLGKMTEYGKDMYNIYSSSDTRLVTGYNLSPLRRDKKSYFDDWDFGALIDGIPYGDPIYAFSVKNNYSAADYIRQGAEKYTKESWQKMLNR